MELLYLWIEDYKNIYRQGFNFSPLYKFEFTPTDFDEEGKVIGGKLEDKMDLKEREDKKKFYKDFFKDETTKNTDYGITNVTAIVGENGAGKSSVLEFLSINSTNEYSYIQIVKKNKQVKIINNKIKVESIFSSVLHSIEYSILKYEYFTTPSDINRNSNFKWVQTSVNQLYDAYSAELLQDNRRLNSEKVFFQVNFLIQNNILEIDSLNVNVKNIDLLDIMRKLDEESMEYDGSGFEPLIHQINLENRGNRANNFIEYKEYIFMCLYELMTTKIHMVIVQIFNDTVILSENERKEFEFILDPRYIINKQNDIVNYRTYIQDYLLYFEDLNIKRHFDFFKYIISLFEIIDSLEEKNYDNVNKCLTLYIEDKYTQEFIESYDNNFYFFDFDLKKDNQIQHLSRGEDALLFQLSTFQNLGKSNTKNSIMIIIDEGELGLHPQWQKQYLKILLDTLPKIFPNKQIQLILTSHSPFLVSDLPKENVIFLEKGADGKCIVAQPTAMKQTFGANIHTLLTNSFFMKDGLTGTFAQDKIDEVIKLLDKSKLEKEEIEHCEIIISMIGEPIVKTMLQKLLDSKRLRKVDEHDDKIERLEKELRKLRGLVNRKTRK
ncbi:AAA family ATPase [Bernardetia sp. OM2101]|uniref:AAA family ATPase n=1 Tax=Bernardetia sp. OM2101 TaxID=3344876 RepID=UPI0035D014BA